MNKSRHSLTRFLMGSWQALLLAVAAIGLAAPRAEAAPIFVSFDVGISLNADAPSTFAPLTGTLNFFQQFCEIGSDTCSTYDLASATIPALQLGESFFPNDPIVPPNPISPGPIYMTLSGLAGGFVAYAFPNDPITPADEPDAAPIIAIASFDADAAIGDAQTLSGLIYAFNSPGTLIGTWEVTTTRVVPEPATLALAAFGLAGIAGVRRLRRRVRP
jgi:hypothetical protein